MMDNSNQRSNKVVAVVTAIGLLWTILTGCGVYIYFRATQDVKISELSNRVGYLETRQSNIEKHQQSLDNRLVLNEEKTRQLADLPNMVRKINENLVSIQQDMKYTRADITEVKTSTTELSTNLNSLATDVRFLKSIVDRK